MASKKIQLYTDRANTIEASPETSANCVILSDGNDLQKVLDNDLTNPTVVHEETSFKVGVGDIDVSSSVVDGEVGRMVVKGKTYQNILPEPSTHVLTNNKEMFKVNEGLDPNVEIVDAVSKSAILSGSTKYQIGEFIQDVYAPVQQFKTGYYLGHDDGTLIKGENNHKYCEDYIPLPTGVSSITSKGSSNWKKLCCYDSNKNFISGVNGTVGLEDLTLNIPSNAKYFRYSTNISQGENEYINVVSNTGLLLASSNYNIPCELVSVKLPVLTTIGKNLYNGKTYKGYINDAGADSWSTDWVRTDYFPVEANTDYYFSVSPPFDNANLRHAYLYDENKKYLGRTNQNNKFRPSVNGFVRCVSQLNGGGTISDDQASCAFFQIAYGTDVSPYEAFKSNILTVNEDVELRGIGDVKDELNLLTGEISNNFNKITIDGTEKWYKSSNETELTVRYRCDNIGVSILKENICICDSYNVGGNTVGDDLVVAFSGTMLTYRVLKSKFPTLEDFKKWLNDNPHTFIYQTEKSIKTVDLSSSGNWEKVVLDGSEDWVKESFTSGIVRWRASLPNTIGNAPCYCDKLPVYPTSDKRDVDYVRCSTNLVWVYQKDTSLTLEQFRAKLQSNPLTVWYQVKNHQDSTQVKQPIFFKDGHIQLSSGADNSLIPTLDYQAKTSNSYVMDLMKANTRYTMKAKSASGNFTLGGSSYSLGTNRVFSTTGAEFNANNMMVITGSYEDLMILEGELTSKTIPYFKGIKSAFEGESKIEVLSTGKNLFDGELFKGYFYGNIGSVHTIKTSENAYCTNTQKVKPNAQYLISFIGKTEKNFIYCRQLDKNGVTLNETSQNFANGYMRVNTVDNCCSLVLCTHANYEFAEPPLFQIEESSSSISTAYEPYKSNSTKIPLLSPLRSLPDGTCDELIIDRMKKKATLIKRLDCITFDGSSDENWHTWGSTNSTSHLNNYHYVDGTNNTKNLKVKVDPSWIVSRLGYGGGYNSKKTGATLNSSYFAFSIPKNSIGAGSGDTDSMYEKSGRAWLSQNPITVYYELATPVVTEIDLENFPLVYKDGHIFLNSEIAPVVEIDYNINQSQQIQSNNETLQRHELDILDLDNLIVSFVDCEYRLKLLAFNIQHDILGECK